MLLYVPSHVIKQFLSPAYYDLHVLANIILAYLALLCRICAAAYRYITVCKEAHIYLLMLTCMYTCRFCFWHVILNKSIL